MPGLGWASVDLGEVRRNDYRESRCRTFASFRAARVTDLDAEESSIYAGKFCDSIRMTGMSKG